MDIDKQISEVMKNYPSLLYDSDSKTFEGKLSVFENDIYEIKIDLDKYPTYFPTVYEIGERIPPIADRHIYTNTKSCCFTTIANSQILLKTKIKTLSIFIKEIIIPYFLSNSYYEINGYYTNTTYSHGSNGVSEGYKDILKLPFETDDFFVARIIYDRINRKVLTIRDFCYCGSGIKLKKCSNGKHDIAYRKFKMVELLTLESDLNDFIQLFAK